MGPSLNFLAKYKKNEKAFNEGWKKARDFFKGKKKSGSNKNKENKSEKEQKSKSQEQPKEKLEPQEQGTKHQDAVKAEREGGANKDLNSATGRAMGGLDKVENGSTVLPGQEMKDTRGKVKEFGEKIEEKDDVQTEKEQLDKSFEEKIGDKKLDQHLEKGEGKRGNSWVDKVRPEKNEMNFDGQEQLGDQSKAIDLMKEESTQFMMPEPENTNEMALTDEQQEKAIDLMGDNNSLESNRTHKTNWSPSTEITTIRLMPTKRLSEATKKLKP